MAVDRKQREFTLASDVRLQRLVGAFNDNQETDDFSAYEDDGAQLRVVHDALGGAFFFAVMTNVRLNDWPSAIVWYQVGAEVQIIVIEQNEGGDVIVRQDRKINVGNFRP